MTDAKKVLRIQGAREHNLKNVSLELPRDELIVFTGLSGSGKSSLAFDTIYAEGQRRYVASLSAYARQFLEMMQKPTTKTRRSPVGGHPMGAWTSPSASVASPTCRRRSTSSRTELRRW